MNAMNAPKTSWQQDTIRVGETELAVVRGGQGSPTLILHEEMGYPGWMRWQSDLAAERTLVIPMHPGFAETERLDWIGSVRDLAGFYIRMLEEQGMIPIDVIGISLGGWLAAEMAACYPGLFRRMVLVAPAGIRPPEGEIYDLYDKYPKTIMTNSVKDPEATPEFEQLYTDRDRLEQVEAWEDARTQTARMAWKPYMYNPSLPHLLEGRKLGPALVIWGRDDAMIPASAASVYQQAIPSCEVEIINNCGHRPEIEQREAFVSRVTEFLNRNS